MSDELGYYTISNLTVSDNLNNDDIQDFDLGEVSTLFEHENTNDDFELKMNWYFDETSRLLCNDEFDDKYPLTTLKTIICNFITPENMTIQGWIISINLNTFDVYFYNLINNEMVKHINKSMDLSSLWKQCRNLYEGYLYDNTLIEPFNHFFPRHTVNEYMLDIDDDIQIFEDLYTYYI